ncbi:MAG: dihydropteroate synthase [bacterium]|jgi:dihydropteroate synthase
MFTLNSRGREFKSEKPLVMGIVNCTDDSFYEGSRVTDRSQLQKKIDAMIEMGVDIIDIGGQSTKPGSVQVSVEVELERISFALEYLNAAYPATWVSIDTLQSEIAAYAVAHGAHIVNDVSGGDMDPNMINTVAELDVPFVCTHMQGRPQTMQQNPQYDDVLEEVNTYFKHKIKACYDAGVRQVIIDPGFGFGKTITHNYTLVKMLEKIVELGYPVLVGFSRKSMIYQLLNITPNEALNGTTVLNTVALLKGAAILRVHDVKEAKETVELVAAIKKA